MNELPDLTFSWEDLGIDESGMPIHLPMGVTADEEGPTSDAEAHHFVCWCGQQCPLDEALRRAAKAASQIPNEDCCLHWAGRHDPDDGSCDQCPCINPDMIEHEDLAEQPSQKTLDHFAAAKAQKSKYCICPPNLIGYVPGCPKHSEDLFEGL